MTLPLFDPTPAPLPKRTRKPAKPKAPHPLAGTLPALDRPDGQVVYRLTYESRPWTLNVERQGNRWKRAKLVGEWRPSFRLLALEAKMRPCSSIAVTVWPEVRHGGGMPDTAACVGAAKAAIDGVVDAGVLPDDGPVYVKRLTFMAPIVSGRDALTLDVAVLS
jgi:hypothetical protein